MNAMDIYFLGRLAPLNNFLTVAGVLAVILAAGTLTYLVAGLMTGRFDDDQPPPPLAPDTARRIATASAIAALATFYAVSLLPSPREAAAMLVFPRADRPLGESADDNLRALAAKWLLDLVPDAGRPAR